MVEKSHKGGLLRVRRSGAVSHLRPAVVSYLLAAALVLIAAPSALAAGGQIEGKVIDATTKHPIEGIEVCANIGDEEFKTPTCAKTGAGGEYAIPELAAGEYVVEFSAPFKSTLNYITQYYRNQPSETTANKVTVSGTTVSGIDAEMAAGGQIAGRVTDGSTGAGLENALVCAFSPSPTETGNCVLTAADGSYTVSGLPTGQYQVLFAAKKYTLQVYNGKAKLSEADLVSVTAPNLTTGINAALAPSVSSAPPSNVTPPSNLTPPGGSSSPALPSPAPRLTISVTRLVVSKGLIRVRVKCTGAPCIGKLILEHYVRPRPSVPGGKGAVPFIVKSKTRIFGRVASQNCCK